MDLVGKTVRWENRLRSPGPWFTAYITGPGSTGCDSYSGIVVDPGTYSSPSSEPWSPGDFVPNLVYEHCTVIDSEPDTQDPECE
jgi:hypothetical protein